MNSRHLYPVLILASLIVTIQDAAGGPRRAARALGAADTLPFESHEKFFERVLKNQQAGPLKPPVARPPASASSFPNVDISSDTFPQNEPSVRISHKDPNRMVAAWRDFRTGVNPAVRRIGYSFSTDGGHTWEPPSLLPLLYSDLGYVRNSDPAVCVDTAGNFYIATIALDSHDGNLKIIVYKSSSLGDYFDFASFAPTDTQSSFFDKEYIVCDLNPSSPFVNNLYIVWSASQFTRSTDGGETWSHVLRYTDTLVSSFGPDIAIGPDGSINVVSLYGSKVIFDRSTDGGVSFTFHRVIDSLGVFNAPRAELPSIAVDIGTGPRRGRIYTVWSDQRYGDDDVLFSSSSDGGVSWSATRRVNDDPVGNGKTQYWPWIAADERGVVSLVYYDNRNVLDSTYTETYFAYSWDGGGSFTNEVISTLPSPHNMPNGAVRFGDYIGLDAWGGHTVPVWTDERAGGYDMSIYTATLDTLPALTFSGITQNVGGGWNLLSLPISPVNSYKSVVFPGASPFVYSYDGSYHIVDTIRSGRGYWARFENPKSYKLFGDSLSTDTIPLAPGWNLIGSVIKPVATSAISPVGTTFASRFFGYSRSYFPADTIHPGRGYWIKASGAGSFVLESATRNAPRLSEDNPARDFNSLSFEDASGGAQTLYFASSAVRADLRFALPPLPPPGVFDVRFASQNFAEGLNDSIGLKILVNWARLPLTVSWCIVDGEGYRLSEAGRELVSELRGEGKLTMESTIGSLVLSREESRPRAFSLHQNYPNPFNPSTVIRYELPMKARVSIRIYDLLGKVVDQLTDGVEGPGYRSISWDGSRAASGVYVCRMVCTSLESPAVAVENIRMLLLK